jgi:DNA-binding transcriptional LysR family regulator
VAEELNFTRAASRLKMAQPPLSIQMRQLEAELGVELFDRSRRAIRLTDAGHALLPEAQRLLNQLDETAAMVQRVGSGAVGSLAIGFIPSATNSVLPPLLRSFGAWAPHVELYLREMTPDDIVRAVTEDHIDVGFLYLPIENSELEVCVVYGEPLVAVIPSNHRLAGRSRIAVRELARDRFILPTRHVVSSLHAEILAVCERAGFTPAAVQKEVWLMQTVLGLVAAGIGVALEPASVRNLRRSGVVYLPLWDASELALAAVWRREHNSAVLREFLRVLHRDTAKRPARDRLVAS